MFEGNMEYLIGAAMGAGATIYFVCRLADDIINYRIDSFWDVAVPVVLILMSIGIATFGTMSYINSLPDKCDKCGEAVSTSYCTNCGTLVETPESVYVCEDCGKEIDTEYCGDCGGKRALLLPIQTETTD